MSNALCLLHAVGGNCCWIAWCCGMFEVQKPAGFLPSGNSYFALHSCVVCADSVSLLEPRGIAIAIMYAVKECLQYASCSHTARVVRLLRHAECAMKRCTRMLNL